jgi:hypothetical protein
VPFPAMTSGSFWHFETTSISGVQTSPYALARRSLTACRMRTPTASAATISERRARPRAAEPLLCLRHSACAKNKLRT